MSALQHLKCAVQRWISSLDRKSLILMYHRVARVDSDPWGLCVTPEHFSEQLEVLRKHCRTMQLAGFHQSLSNGKVPKKCVVITFDDGYADNLQNALPLLERHGVEATVFLVSGQIGKQKEFWWDELEGIFLQPGALPEELELIINGAQKKWNLKDAEFSDEAARRHRNWRTGNIEPTLRHKVYYELWRLMQPLDEAQNQDILDQLGAWRGSGRKLRSSYKTLSSDEVLTLNANRLIEIGGHSVTHPVLSVFSPEIQKWEIETCKQDLEKILGKRVKSFAYPFGQHSPVTMSILKNAGMDCACSTVPETIKGSLNAYQLPRFQAPDIDGDQFAKQLSEWFGEQ